MANLLNIGQTQLGKTGTVKLTELAITGSGQTAQTHGFDRVYTTAATDYKRVNPFEVSASDAPNPTTETAPYNLSDWEGYGQWNSAQAASEDFDCTAFTDTTATFSWTTASGYETDTASLVQVLYVDECTDALTCADAQASSSTTSDVFNLGDVITTTATGLTENTYYVATVVTLWDELGTGFSKRHSDTADSVASPTEGVLNTESQIYFKTSFTSCDSLGTQHAAGTTAGALGGGGACGGLPGSITIYSPDSSTWASLSTSDRLFTDSGCTSGYVGDTYLANNGDTSYIQQSGGAVTAAPTACGI